MEVRFDVIWIDVVAIFLETNCSTKDELFSIAFYKSFSPESTDLFACPLM
jgi:hypothetical protein